MFPECWDTQSCFELVGEGMIREKRSHIIYPKQKLPKQANINMSCSLALCKPQYPPACTASGPKPGWSLDRGSPGQWCFVGPAFGFFGLSPLGQVIVIDLQGSIASPSWPSERPRWGDVFRGNVGSPVPVTGAPVR